MLAILNVMLALDLVQGIGCDNFLFSVWSDSDPSTRPGL